MTQVQPNPSKTRSHVDRIYDQLKQMAIDYKFRPGEPLNEIELAASFGVSRTPLREVLNRLVAEGLLESVPRRGFSGRPLNAKTISDLYEMRCGLEMISAKLATQRASDDEIQHLIEFWQDAAQHYATYSPIECVQFDESFHEQLATLSHNSELLHTLKNINARVHFLRLVSLEQASFRYNTCDEHGIILTAIKQRDAETAATCMSSHVTMRQEQLMDVIKEAVARLYVR